MSSSEEARAEASAGAVRGDASTGHGATSPPRDMLPSPHGSVSVLPDSDRKVHLDLSQLVTLSAIPVTVDLGGSVASTGDVGRLEERIRQLENLTATRQVEAKFTEIGNRLQSLERVMASEERDRRDIEATLADMQQTVDVQAAEIVKLRGELKDEKERSARGERADVHDLAGQLRRVEASVSMLTGPDFPPTPGPTEHPDADVTPVIPVIRDRITALERKSAKDDEAIAALRATNDALSKRVEEAKASLATELRRISDESRDRASELRDTLASTMTSPMAAGARGLKSTPTMEAAPTSALLNLKIGGLTDEVKEIKEWMRSSGADGSGDDTRRELQEAKDDILEVAGRVLDVETRLDQMNTSVDRLGKAVRAGSRRPHSPGPQSATTPVSPAAGNSEAVAAEFARINEELEALREEVAEKATSAELTTAVDAVLTSRGIGRHGAIDSEARSKLERLSRAVEANKDRLARDEAHILAKASQKEVEAAEEEARLATQKVAELEATVGAFGDDGGLGRTLCQWVQLLAQKTQMPLESERAAGSGMSPEEQARLVHNILLEEWGPVIRAKANTVLLEDKADKRDFQRLDRLLAELTKRVALLRSAMSRTMQEHDHAMLSGKPLDPWKCLSCESDVNPATVERERGPSVPTGQLPVTPNKRSGYYFHRPDSSGPAPRGTARMRAARIPGATGTAMALSRASDTPSGRTIEIPSAGMEKPLPQDNSGVDGSAAYDDLGVSASQHRLQTQRDLTDSPAVKANVATARMMGGGASSGDAGGADEPRLPEIP